MHHHIIFYDGYCGLCNASIKLLLHIDKHKIFRYASLQSAFATNTLQPLGINNTNINTFLFYSNGNIYSRSGAVLLIIKKLNMPYKLLYVFNIFPSFMLDFLYNIVAKNRYRIWGKKNTCIIPNKKYQSFFIE